MEERVAKLEERVAELTGLLGPIVAERRQKAKKSLLNKAAREKAKKAKTEANNRLLKNLNACCLRPKGPGAIMGRDARLDQLLPAWAEKCIEFGKKNEPGKFLEWIAWKWNCDTYRTKPITSGQGSLWKFYGYSSSGKPMRTKFSELQLFGKCERLQFSRIQALGFSEAPFWEWGRGVLYQIRSEIEDEVWEGLPLHFRKVVGLMMGGVALVQLKKDLVFDQNSSPTVLNRTYRLAKPFLNLGWKSILMGLKAGREPFPLP